MKFTTPLYTALLFLLILAMVTVGVWFYQQFGSGESDPGGDRGIFSSLFPFGGSSGGLGGIFGDDEEAGSDGPVPKLRKVTEEEVAGAHFATGIQGSPSVRYVERFTGHWYETPLNSLTLLRLTNTTIPAVQDATAVTASTSLMRFLSDNEFVENFLGTYAGTTTDQELSGLFLKPYRHTAVGGETILGVLETENGSTVEVMGPDGESRIVFASPIRSWVPHIADDRLFVSSAPSAFAFGSLYEISGGSLTKRAGGVLGLEVLLNDSAARGLVSGGGQNATRLYVLDTATGAMAPLPQGGLVKKCAWIDTRYALCAIPRGPLPPGFYPDDWYLGRVHTSDDMWFIDTETSAMTIALQLEEESGYAVDVAMLAADSDGSHAIFINRNDQSLWIADLSAR